LGLRWQDLDLDGGRASIRQSVIAIKHTVMIGTLKTAKGGAPSPSTRALLLRFASTERGRLLSGC
jgi:hypothetical protein